jgi:hypothetical protein
MPAMSPVDFAQLLDPWYWFSGFTGPITPITYTLLGLFAVVMVASAVVWVGRRRWFPGHRVKVRLAATYGPWFFGVAALGAFFVLMRLADSPILTARVLWLACLVALVALGVYLVRYLRVGYPLELAAFERDEMRRRFIPKPKARRKRR